MSCLRVHTSSQFCHLKPQLTPQLLDRAMGQLSTILSYFAMGKQPPKEPDDLFDMPWRELGNKDALLQQVKDFHPENDTKIRILLHGPEGAGKSSFINTVNSIFQERMVRNALADNVDADGSFTTKYQTHTIKKGHGQNFYPFVFSDIMGLDTKKQHGVCEEDIILAMKGHVSEGYEMNPTASLSQEKADYRKSPTLEDKAHVLVCVMPAVAVSSLKDEMINKIRHIRLKARDIGIPQLCILTKIDGVVEKDLQSVYKIKLVKEKMEEFSSKVGIPLSCIFPVKNYDEEAELKDDVDVLILTALKEMIRSGEDFINQSITNP